MRHRSPLVVLPLLMILERGYLIFKASMWEFFLTLEEIQVARLLVASLCAIFTNLMLYNYTLLKINKPWK